MNKLMAMLFLLGAFGGFGLATSTSYQVQDQTPHGAPVGQPRTVYVKSSDRAVFIVFDSVCMAGSLYFLAKIRRDDLK